MILGPRFDPVPPILAPLALPEPGGAFQMIHHAVRRLERRAAMRCGGGHQYDRLPRRHDANPVPGKQAIERESLCRGFGKLPHRR